MTESFHFDLPGTIGPFRVGRLLGEGGMGSVYLGERDDIATQRVAIKILRPAPFAATIGIETEHTRTEQTQTEHEAKMLTALEHPNIVRLLDRGVTGSGLQYFVMEYVDGVAIDEYCDRRRMALRERIRLLLRVMHAVEHAHQRLVIHADLKPSNILVTDDGEPKLMDFGIATIAGLAPAQFDLYTPEFASPEQRAGERLTVSSDIYSLGIVVRLVLAGVLPPASAWKAQEPESVARGLRKLDEEALRKTAEARATTPERLIDAINGDLEAILAKALRTSSAERYLSVNNFASDLESFLDYRPVAARRGNFVHVARRWIQRHRIAAAVGVVLFLVVALSISGVVFQAAHAAQQRRLAQNRLHEMVRLTGALDGELYDSIRALTQSGDAKRSLLKQATATLDRLAVDDNKDPVLALELARQYAKLAQLQNSDDKQSQANERQASLDVAKGIAVLNRISRTDPEYDEQQKQLSELLELQKRIGH